MYFMFFYLLCIMFKVVIIKFAVSDPLGWSKEAANACQHCDIV